MNALKCWLWINRQVVCGIALVLSVCGVFPAVICTAAGVLAPVWCIIIVAVVASMWAVAHWLHTSIALGDVLNSVLITRVVWHNNRHTVQWSADGNRWYVYANIDAIGGQQQAGVARAQFKDEISKVPRSTETVVIESD